MKTILHGHSVNNGLVSTVLMSELLGLPCDGIELDIREYKGITVVAHDATDAPQGESLERLLSLIATSNKMLLLELKEYNHNFFEKVVRSVIAHGLEQRTALFAFPAIGRLFSWEGECPVPLAIIEPFPWRIARVAKELRPYMIMVGWGSKWAKFTYYPEKILFKIFWNLLRPSPVNSKVVVGSLRGSSELEWAKDQGVFFAAICDLNCFDHEK